MVSGSRTLGAAAAIGLAVLNVAAVVQSIQKTAAEQKPIQHRKGRSIVELVKPGRDITIEKDQSPPHYVLAPKGTSQLEWMTSLAPFVLIARVELVSEVTPAGDWVETSVQAQITDVLKKPVSDSLSPGDTIAFTADGGEVRIAGALVRAVVPWRHHLERGETYLLFAKRDSTGIWETDLGTAYRINAATQSLQSLRRRPTAILEEGVPLQEALARIRAAVRIHPVR